MANNNQLTVGQSGGALETLQDAAKLVQVYARKLVSDERAAEFATHISIMAQQNPKIRECNPLSVVNAMMACVRLNLMPNTPEQYVALIPYGKELQFQVMYRGLTQLAYNSGIVNKIDAQLVFPEDDWSIEEGTDRKLVHRWTAESLARDRTKADEALFAYATAILNTGEKTFVIMTQSEIKEIKEKAVKATGNDTPWSRWPAEQYKKTVVKRFTKLLPKSSEDNRLAYAIQADNLAEAGKLKVDAATGDVIEGEVIDNSDSRKAKIRAAEAKHNELTSQEFTPQPIKSQE